MDSIKGSFIDLECIVAGSHPISIQWFKDDQEISASDKYKFSFHDNTAFLEISQLEGTDSGTYSCSATNKAGHSQCSGHLTVKGWAVLISTPPNSVALLFLILLFFIESENKSVSFFCFLLFHPRTPLLCGEATVTRRESQHEGSVEGSGGRHRAHDNKVVQR